MYPGGVTRVDCHGGIGPGLIATVTLNPSLDRTVETPHLVKDDANQVREVSLDPGGKGINVSRVLRRLGAHTVAFAPIGGTTGERLARLLDREEVPTCLLRIRGETRVNLILNDLSDNSQTRLHFPGAPVDRDELGNLLKDLAGIEPRPAFWVLAGSMPPGVPADTWASWVGAAKRLGIPVLVDSDGEPLRLAVAAGADWIKPNEFELARLVGRPLPDEGSILAACREILDQGVQGVVASFGARGALAVDQGSAEWLVPPSVTPCSRVGAGDSTVAGLVWRLVEGDSLAEAARWGVAAGTAAVLTPGTELAHAEDVYRLVTQVVGRAARGA